MNAPHARRKLIEIDLPLDVINAESAREKSIRHGHPSTLHLWWARRPLAACRAVLFASLVDDPADCPEFPDPDAQRAERQRLHDLIKRLVKWENSSDPNLLAEARYEIARSIARAAGDTAPNDPAAVLDYLNNQAKPIYDPFCGGGSIPLEAQRLGLRAVGSDLNPVAVLITKALIELPPQFAHRPPVNPDADHLGLTTGKGKNAKKTPWRGAAGLADDVRYYGRQMRELAWRRIGHLYPQVPRPGGGPATVIAWLWARTIPCPNPACGIAMPLIRNWQLSTKKNNLHWMKPVIDRDNRSVSFVVQNHNRDIPKNGTVNRNSATCLACHGAVALEYVRQQARAGNMGETMTCVVAEGDRNRIFMSTNPEIKKIVSRAAAPWKPQQPMPTTAYKVSGRGYGITHWHQLFTERQLTALTAFSDMLAEVKQLVIQDGATEEYANAVVTYLALVVSKLSDSNSSFSTYHVPMECVRNVFARQAIPMAWDFAEGNPFADAAGTWNLFLDKVVKVLERLPETNNHGQVHQADAATTIHADNGPVIVTDPPYYDNISYAELSDFFYVWLRPLLREIYPDLFSGIRVPTQEEMIAAPRFDNADARFESLLGQALRLIRERCSPDFPSSIFYAYKQQEQERDGVTSTGWETMLTALINAGFHVVGTWPMRTEFTSRSNAMAANTLASSVVLVCRPRPADAPVANRGEFIAALGREMPPKLDQLTREAHIAPVDLRQAAIGMGMAVYSRYRSVATLAGEPVTVRQALMAINDAVDHYLRQQAGELDAESRFCLDWLQAHPKGQGDYGIAETLAVAYDMSVYDRLAQTHGLLRAGQGWVILHGLDAYDNDRPYPDGEEVTAWESCLRMAWQMQPGDDRRGVAGCAAVARRAAAAGRLDSVERLARILYDHHNTRHESQQAVAYNNVVTAWPEILREAARADTALLIN